MPRPVSLALSARDESSVAAVAAAMSAGRVVVVVGPFVLMKASASPSMGNAKLSPARRAARAPILQCSSAQRAMLRQGFIPYFPSNRYVWRGRKQFLL